MQAVLVEDEQDARTNLKLLLEKFCPSIDVIGEADSVEAGVTCIEEKKPALALLDIQLPDGTAFDLLNRLTTATPKVIFVTAYDRFAIKAFRYHALDYLLKPFDPDDLIEAVRRAEAAFAPEQPGKKLALTNSDGIYFVLVSDIIRLESFKNYTTFHFANRSPLTFSKTLGDFEPLLAPYGFFRPHKSHIINLESVDHWKKDAGDIIVMADKSQLPLSRRKKDAFRQAMSVIHLQ